MTDRSLITDVLKAPLEAGWSVEQLAERLLDAIAAAGDGSFVFEVEESTDRQVVRLIRPLLARLAVLSAAESEVPPHLHGGRLFFERVSPDGPVWIVGRFANQPARVWIAVHRTASASTSCDRRAGAVTAS